MMMSTLDSQTITPSIRATLIKYTDTMHVVKCHLPSYCILYDLQLQCAKYRNYSLIYQMINKARKLTDTWQYMGRILYSTSFFQLVADVFNYRPSALPVERWLIMYSVASVRVCLSVIISCQQCISKASLPNSWQTLHTCYCENDYHSRCDPGRMDPEFAVFYHVTYTV